MTVSDTITSLRAALASKYVLERELGRGGMATVYLARDLRHDRPVALKVLRPELATSLGPGRFQREIHLAARLSHPNILPLFDSGEADGRFWYAMPYVQGESLRQRLGRETQLGVAEAVRITSQVTGALAYAHGQGIVHRDIKPENILLAGDQVLVADFGIAKAVDASSAEKLTETGLSLGTPAYMSPEQAAGGAVDARSDIYALGCVLYEMLAGMPPFSGPTAQAVMARHSVDPVPPLRTVRAAIPWAVEQAVVQALAKVPADRFASAAEFAEALVADLPPGPRFPWSLSARAMRIVLGTIAGTCVAVVAAWTLKERSISPVVPSAEAIAVLPLVSTASDTGLIRLGRDLAVTISASLDGIGAIQTADRFSIANATDGRPSLSPGDGAALARRLGARSILRGTLVRAGDNVRLDIGLYGTEGLAPVAEGITVGNHRDSIVALSDSVVWALLRQVWRRGEPPTPSLTAVTTRSLPALRSFLDGERHLERGWWQSAALAYRSAIAIDSTFWLAYFRYADVRSWEEEDVEPEILQAALRHLDVLPERERLLVEAYGNPGEWGNLGKYRDLTRRFPEFWPAWFKLGDWLHHVGPLRGHTWKDAHEALGRAVALNPDLEPAWDHLFRNSVGWDTALSRQAFERLEHLQSPDPASNNRARADQRVYRLLQLRLSAGVLLPRDTALADSIARLSLSPEASDLLAHQAPIGFLWAGNPVGQVEFSRRLIRAAGNSDKAAAGHMGMAWAWAERGAWDSALAAMHLAALGRPSQFAIHDYSLAVLGAWLGVVPPAVAAERRQPAARAAARSLDEESRAQLLGTLAWLDGLAAFARRDRAALTRAGTDARASGHPAAPNIERSLAAFRRALSGARGAAGRELAALERECAERAGTCDMTAPNIAANRLAAATWLLEEGDTVQATHLLTWHDAHPGGPWLWSFVVTPLALLTQARIAEASGDSAPAREYYRHFLRRYDRPMPAQAHLVEDARAALARLSGSPAPAGDP